MTLVSKTRILLVCGALIAFGVLLQEAEPPAVGIAPRVICNEEYDPPCPSEALPPEGVTAYCARLSTRGGYDPAMCYPYGEDMLKPAPSVANVTLMTTEGAFTVEVHREWGPVSADRFYNLARLGYYEDSAFYRVVQSWVVQFGPSATPSLSAVYANNNCMDAGVPPCQVDGACFFPSQGPTRPPKASNKRGYMAISTDSWLSVCGDDKCSCAPTPSFCHAKPYSEDQLVGASEVFINLVDNDGSPGGSGISLDDYGFTPFAVVVEGMEVVDRLYGGYGEMSCAAGMCGKGGDAEGGACMVGDAPSCASKHDPTVNCNAPQLREAYQGGSELLREAYADLSFITTVSVAPTTRDLLAAAASWYGWLIGYLWV